MNSILKTTIKEEGNIVQIIVYVDYKEVCNLDGEDLGNWDCEINNLTELFKIDFDSYVEIEFESIEEFEEWKKLKEIE